MSAEESKALVVAYMSAISGKEKPAEVIDRYISDADDTLKQHVRDGELIFPCYELRPLTIIAEGDTVAVSVTLAAKHAASGTLVEVPGMYWYRVQNGKIVEHRSMLDNRELLTQLAIGEAEIAAARG